MNRCKHTGFALTLILLSSLIGNSASGSAGPNAERPLVLAHYMPWYMAKPHSTIWGWHWTMNHFAPDTQVKGRRDIASHYYPLIGPYDSGDADVLEYQLLTMKMAGIDGVIVDWYGLSKFRDYAFLHKNTQRLVEQLERLGMKFAICYEDQTIPALVKAERIKESDRVSHAAEELKWLSENWFELKSYVRIDGKPALLSFGQTGLSDQEWTECLKAADFAISYFSEHHRRASAIGAFDWPIPKQGLTANAKFRKNSKAWPFAVQVAFPRFVDVYKKAGLHDGYGLVEDKDGTTFRTSFADAMKTGSAIVQIATWNDWGEGTQIEPSKEYGYRDLEFVQKTQRQVLGQGFKFTSGDLRLPAALLKLRQNKSVPLEALDKAAALLADGSVDMARSVIERLTSREPKP